MNSWKREYTIDSVKTIAAFGIIFMHFPFQGNMGKAVTAIALMGVPYFFMVAGYFCFSEKHNFDKQALENKVLHLLHIALYAWGVCPI